MSSRFWTGKRVFITGHSGFKGAWLSVWLDLLGARVEGYSLPPAAQPSLWDLIAKDVQVASRFGDVRNPQAIRQAIEGCRPEIVFHLAAQSLVRTSYEDPLGTYATNVMGTVHLLEALRHAPSVRAVVVVTSDKCYDNRETGHAYVEHDPMGGRDPYSSSKGCAELVTAAYRASFFGQASRTAIATARAGNVIGGGDWAIDRILPDAVRAATSGTSLLVRNPAAVRPWQHVLEPLAGYLLLGQRLHEEGERFAQAWNFGPDEEDAVSVEEVVSTFAALWGPPARWQKDRQILHPHEANLLKLNSEKARSLLGWRPRLKLKGALEWTVHWYRGHYEGHGARALCVEQIERYMELAT